MAKKKQQSAQKSSFKQVSSMLLSGTGLMLIVGALLVIAGWGAEGDTSPFLIGFGSAFLMISASTILYWTAVSK